MDSEEPEHLSSRESEAPESKEFELGGEQYLALKKSDFVQYEEMVDLAHHLMLDCVDRIFKMFKAIPQQAVVPPPPGIEDEED